jgi:hypothetical protein
MFETAITHLPPGTGFLLPETIAQKAPREKTAQRPHHPPCPIRGVVTLVRKKLKLDPRAKSVRL